MIQKAVIKYPKNVKEKARKGQFDQVLAFFIYFVDSDDET